MQKTNAWLTVGALAFMALSNAQAGEGPGYGVVVYPERPTTLEMSNRDINRVVCTDGGFEDYKYSGEKGIVVEASGSDAFVKFQILEIGSERQYVTARSEFFFRCGGEMYTLFGSPRDIPSQTVFLGGALGQGAKKNAELFNPLSDEERALTITRQALKETAPASYSKTLLDDPYRDGLVAGVDIRKRTHYRVEGSGFAASVFLVRAARDVTLSEMMFVGPAFGRSIYAVTIERPQLKSGEVTRAVLVYRGDGR